MVGMVTALSGLYFGNIIESLTRKEKSAENLVYGKLMRNRFKNRSEQEDAGIDMTPMLDIVFIMLIFSSLRRPSLRNQE